MLHIGFIAPVDAAALTLAHEPGFAAGKGLAQTLVRARSESALHFTEIN